MELLTMQGLVRAIILVVLYFGYEILFNGLEVSRDVLVKICVAFLVILAIDIILNSLGLFPQQSPDLLDVIKSKLSSLLN